MRQDMLFISHGAPSMAVAENGYTAALGRAGRRFDLAVGIVVLSAHWQSEPLRVTLAEKPKTLHDFVGFPDALYQIEYAAAGSPALAAAVAQCTSALGERERGRDHGVWVPLRHVRPAADLPVVQLSLPRRLEGSDLVSLGRALAPLRDEGVALIGSGGVVHNLARLEPWSDRPADWALAFDRWVAERALRLELGPLLQFRRDAPYANLAAPTAEHLAPLLVVLGAALPGDRVHSLFDGFELGTLSLRTFVCEARAAVSSGSFRRLDG